MKHLIFSLTAVLFLSLTSCGSDDEPNGFDDVTMKAGETKTINNASSATWKSSNEFIATLEGGTLKGIRVGKARLTSSAGSFNVTVNPVSKLFIEPCLDFGASKSTVKSWMSKNIKSADLLSDKNDVLSYTSTAAVKYYQYKLTNGALDASYAYVKSGYSSELVDFLLERYISVTVEDDYVGMISPEKDMLIVVLTAKVSGSYYYQVCYAPYESSATRAANFMITDKAKEAKSAAESRGMTLESIPQALKAKFNAGK